MNKLHAASFKVNFAEIPMFSDPDNGTKLPLYFSHASANRETTLLFNRFENCNTQVESMTVRAEGTLLNWVSRWRLRLKLLHDSSPSRIAGTIAEFGLVSAENAEWIAYPEFVIKGQTIGSCSMKKSLVFSLLYLARGTSLLKRDSATETNLIKDGDFEMYCTPFLRNINACLVKDIDWTVSDGGGSGFVNLVHRSLACKEGSILIGN